MSSKNGIKHLFSMEKNHSPHVVTFTPDPQDSHFVDVRIIRKATGEVRGQHYILKSDMPTWISYYEGDNFVIVEQNNEDNGL